MRRTVRLTERDLTRLVRRVLNENKPITYDFDECAQNNFGPGVLPKIPTCVKLAKYHLYVKKYKFDKNDKYDKTLIPACRRELDKVESGGGTPGLVYGYMDFMNCICSCVNCFGHENVANFK
jgi:hypothetical protein